jgi:flagellar biosynthesis/type III secretory pathway chaperone
MAMQTLISALETQLQLLEGFYDLLSRETRELSEIHLDAMAEINSQKESIAARIEAQSVLVRKEIEEAAIREGLSAKATLGELAAKCNQKDITRFHKDLNSVAGRIKQISSANCDIAERFAASVASSLSLLTRVINQSNTYGSSGSYQQRTTGAVMINREA